MAFTDETDNAITSLTDEGRRLYTRASLGGVSFKLYGWALGRGGYNPTNPVKVEAIDTGLTDLIDKVWPATGLALLGTEYYEYPNNRAISIICRVPRQDVTARYGFGELGVWVEVLKSEAYTLERIRAGNVATLITSFSHGLTSGDVVDVSGMTDASYNGTGLTVTVVDSKTFTYPSTGPDESSTPDTGGIVSNPNDIGSHVLYSVSHFPIQGKIDDEAAIWRPIIQM